MDRTAAVREGDVFALDMRVVFEEAGRGMGMGNWLKVVKDTVRYGGGKVKVVKPGVRYVEVVADAPMGGVMGSVTVPLAALRTAGAVRAALAGEMLRLAKELVGMEFPTRDAMDKYLKEHPDADRSKHKVVETKEEAPAGKGKGEGADEAKERVHADIGKGIEKALGRHSPSNVKVDMSYPRVTVDVKTDLSGVKPKYKGDYESTRRYSVTFSERDGKYVAEVHAGAPGSAESHHVGTKVFGEEAPGSSAVMGWMAGLVKADVRRKYGWDEKPEKQASEVVMDRAALAGEVLRLAEELVGMEFPSQDALDKYLKEHPDADRGKHKVVKTKEDGGHHPVVQRALKDKNVVDVGQLSKEDRAALEKAVKDGVLKKGKGGGYPNLKTVYAHPDYDIEGEHKKRVEELEKS